VAENPECRLGFGGIVTNYRDFFFLQPDPSPRIEFHFDLSGFPRRQHGGRESRNDATAAGTHFPELQGMPTRIGDLEYYSRELALVHGAQIELSLIEFGFWGVGGLRTGLGEALQQVGTDVDFFQRMAGIGGGKQEVVKRESPIILEGSFVGDRQHASITG